MNNIYQPNSKNIQFLAGLLASDELVGMPTETVYGLAGNASSSKACAKIFTTKGRPENHPLIVHIPDIGFLEKWVDTINATHWQSALTLAEYFWPGPLTFILPKASHVISAVTGGQNTVGLRCPQHVDALTLLKEFALHESFGGLAAPSANRFGRISPTSALDVFDELGLSVKGILDGGMCQVGIESTILDLSRTKPVILRPGHISAEHIEDILKCKLNQAQEEKHNAPRVSGALPSHYAPSRPCYMLTRAEIQAKIDLGESAGIICWSGGFLTSSSTIRQVLLGQNAVQYAHEIYHTLRDFDHTEQQIWIETLPNTSDWLALQDRLSRACYRVSPSLR